MAADTITNFLQSTKSILADVKAKVLATSLVKKVHIIAGDEFEHLFRHVPAHATLPTVVCGYLGSTYQESPRRNYKFTVIVGARCVTDDEVGQNRTFDLIDTVIGAIDHEVYNDQVIYKVVADKWLDKTNSGMILYKVDFVAEDY